MVVKTMAACNKMVASNCALMCTGITYCDKQLEYESTLENVYTFPLAEAPTRSSFAPSTPVATQEEIRQYMSSQRQE